MHLASVSLDVEEACSGIRSLMSLTALGLLYAYLAYSNWLLRLLLLLAIVPIAIAANVFRVTMTGLLAHYVSVDTALGVFHTAGGWSVFIIAAALLLGVSRLLRILVRGEMTGMTGRMLVVGAMLLLSSWAVRAVGHGEPVALRQPFAGFPQIVGRMAGRGPALHRTHREQAWRHRLRVQDVSHAARPSVHLYVGFYASQQHGAMLHSPKNCLPGNGWFIARRDTTTVNVAPVPIPSRRTVTPSETASTSSSSSTGISSREAGSSPTSISGVCYLVVDALTKGRSDAALIRVSVPFEDDAAAAERTALEFIQSRLPGAGAASFHTTSPHPIPVHPASPEHDVPQHAHARDSAEPSRYFRDGHPGGGRRAADAVPQPWPEAAGIRVRVCRLRGRALCHRHQQRNGRAPSGGESARHRPRR